jgi:hypothetical protein
VRLPRPNQNDTFIWPKSSIQKYVAKCAWATRLLPTQRLWMVLLVVEWRSVMFAVMAEPKFREGVGVTEDTRNACLRFETYLLGVFSSI